jgi:hypothetical protein
MPDEPSADPCSSSIQATPADELPAPRTYDPRNGPGRRLPRDSPVVVPAVRTCGPREHPDPGHRRRLVDWPFCRGVAQPGSALEWGSRGRTFESSRPDQISRTRPLWATRWAFAVPADPIDPVPLRLSDAGSRPRARWRDLALGSGPSPRGVHPMWLLVRSGGLRHGPPNGRHRGTLRPGGQAAGGGAQAPGDMAGGPHGRSGRTTGPHRGGPGVSARSLCGAGPIPGVPTVCQGVNRLVRRAGAGDPDDSVGRSDILGRSGVVCAPA